MPERDLTIPEAGLIASLLDDISDTRPKRPALATGGQIFGLFLAAIDWSNPAVPPQDERTKVVSPGTMTVAEFLAGVGWENRPESTAADAPGGKGAMTVAEVMGSFVWD